MSQPNWVTSSGSLGTIPEGKFYRASLEAFDPDFPSDSSKVKYSKISGSLPEGIQINNHGIIEGVPVAFTQGVPVEVSKNITSKFSIRVYNEAINSDGILEIDSLNDRTFTITVTGQDAPEFVTPSGTLGTYYNGQLINTQIVFTDSDPSDTAVVSLVDGELPKGVTISEAGLIYGYIEAVQDIGDATSGFENEAWDAYPYQFNTPTISKNYQFTLKISDGTDFNLRTFSIFVGILTVDSTTQTCDGDLIRVDFASRTPYINGYVENLGKFLHNNHFIHELDGVDFNNDTLNYSIHAGSLPSGLVLNTDTGVIHGTIADVALTETEISFTVKVYKKDNPTISALFPFKITIVGDIDTGVTWTTDKDLGVINNGDTSILSIKASSINSGTVLKYRLKSGGIYNKLPQGLSIHESGDIHGVVNYNMFGIYDYHITCDADDTVDTQLIRTDISGSDFITIDGGKTTFDNKFVFTVEAYTDDGTISTFKTFTVLVNRKHISPLHSIQLSGLIPPKSKTILNTILSNNVINQALLYRPADPNFGMATNVSLGHVYGLSPEILDSYIESMKLNHYHKRLILGEIETAKATDDAGNTIYEVVYSKVIDDLVDEKGNSVSSSVDFNHGITAYPNSLNNMRNRVVDKVGQISQDLPRWMLSKQSNGTVLGFTPAWVIAYALPGQSDTIKYAIDSNAAININKIDFTIDRYTLVSQFTANWNAEDYRWNKYDTTSFDIHTHGISAGYSSETADDTSTTVDLVSPTSKETTFDNDSCLFIGVRNNSADLTIKTADDGVITADNGIKDTHLSSDNIGKFNKHLKFPNITI